MLIFVGDICWECDGSRASFRFERYAGGGGFLTSFIFQLTWVRVSNPAWWHSKSGSISSKYIFCPIGMSRATKLSCLFVILSASIHVKGAPSSRLDFRANHSTPKKICSQCKKCIGCQIRDWVRLILKFLIITFKIVSLGRYVVE